MGSLELCLIGGVLGALIWNYSFGSWSYRPKTTADNLNDDAGRGMCIGSSENHEFEESHGEIMKISTELIFWSFNT